MTREPTEQVLLRAGHVEPWQVQRAIAHQKRAGGTVVEALVALGFLSEQLALTEVARQLGVPYRDLAHLYVPPEIVALVPEKLIRARKVFPIDVAAESRRGPLIVATAAPHDLTVLDEVAFATELQVRAVLSSAADVERAIERYLGPAAKRAAPLVARAPAAPAPWRDDPFAKAVPPPLPAKRPAAAGTALGDWTHLRFSA